MRPGEYRVPAVDDLHRLNAHRHDAGEQVEDVPRVADLGLHVLDVGLDADLVQYRFQCADCRGVTDHLQRGL